MLSPHRRAGLPASDSLISALQVSNFATFSTLEEDAALAGTAKLSPSDPCSRALTRSRTTGWILSSIYAHPNNSNRRSLHGASHQSHRPPVPHRSSPFSALVTSSWVRSVKYVGMGQNPTTGHLWRCCSHGAETKRTATINELGSSKQEWRW